MFDIYERKKKTFEKNAEKNEDNTSPKLNSLAVQKYQYLQNKLEQLLLSDLSLIDQALQKTQNDEDEFVRSSDIEQIGELYHLLPSKEDERISLLFSSLRHYFNSGILLKNEEKDQGYPLRGFCDGQMFSYPPSNKGWIPTPQTQLFEVLKTKNLKILELLKVQEIASDEDSIFFMSPSPNYSLILMVDTPEPWLQIYIEKARDIIIKNLTV